MHILHSGEAKPVARDRYTGKSYSITMIMHGPRAWRGQKGEKHPFLPHVGNEELHSWSAPHVTLLNPRSKWSLLQVNVTMVPTVICSLLSLLVPPLGAETSLQSGAKFKDKIINSGKLTQMWWGKCVQRMMSMTVRLKTYIDILIAFDAAPIRPKKFMYDVTTMYVNCSNLPKDVQM